MMISGKEFNTLYKNKKFYLISGKNDKLSNDSYLYETTYDPHIYLKKNNNLTSIKFDDLDENVYINQLNKYIREVNILEDSVVYISTEFGNCKRFITNKLFLHERQKLKNCGLFNNSEICERLAMRHPFALRFIPEEMITNELAEKVTHKMFEGIIYLPKQFRNKTVCNIAVNKHGDLLVCVPSEYITAKLCELAVLNGLSHMDCIPIEFLTKKICDLAFEKNYLLNAKGIPVEFLTNDVCMKITINVINKHSHYYNGEDRILKSFRTIPDQFKTIELCKLLSVKFPNTIKHFPKNIFLL